MSSSRWQDKDRSKKLDPGKTDGREREQQSQSPIEIDSLNNSCGKKEKTDNDKSATRLNSIPEKQNRSKKSNEPSSHSCEGKHKEPPPLELPPTQIPKELYVTVDGGSKVIEDNKVSIVGCGAVGIACAVSILFKGVTNHLTLVDRDGRKAAGEKMDLQHGLSFLNHANITSSADYKAIEGSKIVIITAGHRQKGSETRYDVLHKNISIFKEVIPCIARYNSECVLIIVSNPVDVLTYVAWKLSGFPVNRVIGSGTNLEISRLKFLISQRLDVALENVDGWVIGEHGPLCVPLWSTINIAGVRLVEILPEIGTENDKEKWKILIDEVIKGGPTVRSLKGHTNWAVGLSVSVIVQSILFDEHKMHAVSTSAQGMYGIDYVVFLSLPCVIGKNGISHIVKQKLTETECYQLHAAAEYINNALKELEL